MKGYVKPIMIAIVAGGGAAYAANETMLAAVREFEGPISWPMGHYFTFDVKPGRCAG